MTTGAAAMLIYYRCLSRANKEEKEFANLHAPLVYGAIVIKIPEGSANHQSSVLINYDELYVDILYGCAMAGLIM